jgi:hypothetical protein
MRMRHMLVTIHRCFVDACQMRAAVCSGHACAVPPHMLLLLLLGLA